MAQSFLSWSRRAKNASAGLSALPVFLGMVSLRKHPFWKDAAMSEIQGSQGGNPFRTG